MFVDNARAYSFPTDFVPYHRCIADVMVIEQLLMKNRSTDLVRGKGFSGVLVLVVYF